MAHLIETRSDNTPVKSTWRPPAVELPSHVNVLVVGGGIAGASVAYHLAKMGWDGVCVVEQNFVASGTTWHSAGQVGQLRSSSAQTQVNKASAELYARLHDESGHDPGWLECGGLQLANCQERMYQLQRSASMAEVYGVDAQVISASECGQYWPSLRTEDLVGGVHLPGDGRVLPGECTVALLKAAAANGVALVENVRVNRLRFNRHRTGRKQFVGAATNHGDVTANWIVLATNMWMRQLGLTADVDIPVYPCEHHYLVTRPMNGVTRNCPCTRDPDAGTYFRSLDDGGMILGGFKRRSKYWSIGDCVPNDFSFQLLEPDWPDFEQPFRDLCHRLPGLSRDDVVKFVNGPEAFTPDNNFLLGQPAETDGLFVCGGWNSAGIACSGGAGKYAAEWMENGGMTLDLSAVDVRRFMPLQNKRQYLQQRVTEVLGLHYQMAWPGRQMETSRRARASALYEAHLQNNACFGETAGWERPLYFAPEGTTPETQYSFLQQNWQPWVAEEVRACRENVALLDQSTFGKFELCGPDAVSVLQLLCGGNVDQEIGKAVYTGMFNTRGGFESDLTVVRTAKDVFYLVTATGQQRSDFDWIQRHIGDANVSLQDVTESRNVVSVMGPNSRRLLQELSADDFSDTGFPFGEARPMQVGAHSVLAIRISYVGELGWELHVPVSQARFLYDEIMAAGRPLGLRVIGNHAINTMRIEKGFRAMGHELSPLDSPLEAGLGFAIDWSKDFQGKDALLQQRVNGIRRRLLMFAVEDDSIGLWGGEPILRDGAVCGYTSSACVSPTYGCSVALGYVNSAAPESLNPDHLLASKFEIVHHSKPYPVRAGLKRGTGG